MAYLNPPNAKRFEYHRDGSFATIWNSNTGTVTNIPSTSMVPVCDLNNNAITGAALTNGTFFIIFPEPRDIVAYSLSWNHSSWSPTTIVTSVDTRFGLDGTWVQQTTSLPAKWKNATPSILLNPESVSWSNVRGVGLGTANSFSLYEFQLWGTYSKTGLEFYHATNNSPMDGTNFDFGDVVQGGVYYRSFRIKNNDATRIANNVTMSINTDTGQSGVITNTLLFSVDGSAYEANPVVNNIGPGSFSPIITLRRSVSTGATAGIIGVGTINATAQSWT